MQQLRSHLLTGAEYRALDYVDIVDDLEGQLAVRRATLEEAASKAGTDATKIAAHVINERAKMRPVAGTTPSPSGSVGLTTVQDAVEAALLGTTGGFRAVSAIISGLDTSTAEGKRDAIAAGFTGDSVLTIRALVNTTEGGDPVVARNSSLATLSELRPYLYEYFNYIYRVDKATGLVPAHMTKYTFATATSKDLFNRALKFQFVGTDFLSAPHGALGLKMVRDGRKAPMTIHPADHYCVPSVIEDVGDFVHTLLVGMGASNSIDAGIGYTFKSFCDFYKRHLEKASRLDSKKEQFAHLTHAVEQFTSVLLLLEKTLSVAVFSKAPAEKSIAGVLIPLDCDPVEELNRRARSMDKMQADRADWEMFRGSASTLTAAYDSYTIPRLSELPAEVKIKTRAISKGKGAKGAKGGSDDPAATVGGRALGKRQAAGDDVAADQGSAPGSMAKAHKWLGSHLVVSGLVWDVAALAGHLGVGLDKVEWPYLLSKCQDRNRPARCCAWGTKGHTSTTSSAHVIPGHEQGLDIPALVPHFAVDATSEQMQGIQRHGGAASANKPAKGARAKAKGRGARGRNARGGRNKGRGAPLLLDWDEGTEAGDDDGNQGFEQPPGPQGTPGGVSAGADLTSAGSPSTPLLAILGGGSLSLPPPPSMATVGDASAAAIMRPAAPAASETPRSFLSPPLKTLATRVEPNMLIDVGGQGQCGPNTLVYLLGLVQLSDEDGPGLRRIIVAHVTTHGSRVTTVRDGATNLTLAQLAVYAMAHWPADARKGATPSVAGWCDLIRRPETWTDIAFVAAVADKFRSSVTLEAVDDLSHTWSMGSIMPCNGVAPQADLRVGCWFNRHFVAIVAKLPRGEGEASDPPSQPPPSVTPAVLTTTADIAALLLGDSPPRFLVGMEFSSAMQSALHRRYPPGSALSVDRRPSDSPDGPHAQMDVQVVISVSQHVGHIWEGVFLFPNCFQQLRADDDCLAAKIADGRAFWGCLMVLWCLCVPNARFVVVEQPDTIVYDFVDVDQLPDVSIHEFRTSQYGDGADSDRFVRLATRNVNLSAPSLPPSAARDPQRSHRQFANADQRDRARSTWLPLRRTCDALASVTVRRTSFVPLEYGALAQAFAVAWDARGNPVPAGYLSPTAQPPTAAARSYQHVRGPGSGAPVDAVCPRGSQAGTDEENGLEGATAIGEDPDGNGPGVAIEALMIMCGHVDFEQGDALAPDGGSDDGGELAWPSLGPRVSFGADEDSEAARVPPPPPFDPPDGIVLDFRTASEASAVLIFICVLIQPLVLAHVNGFSVVGLHLPAEKRPIAMSRIQALCAMLVSTFHIAFMVGEYLRGARLFTAPVDFAPPPRAICRTPQQRRRWAAGGATFVWCTLSALRGTAVADPATRSVVSASMFTKPSALLPDSILDSSEEGVVFKFGASAARSVIRRPLLDSEQSPPAWRALNAMAKADRCLIDSILADVERGDSLLEGWAEQVCPLNVAEVPEGLMAALPDFSDPKLDFVALTTVPRPIRTPWLPLPPLQPPAPSDAPACPRSPLEMLLPAGRLKLEEWLSSTRRDLASIQRQLADGVPASEVRREQVEPAVAIGQSELHAWARDRVWDCTRLRSSCCIVADFQPPIETETHLNLVEMRRRLWAYPDQTLVANLLEGARLDADVELQTVLIRHLASLPLGFASVQKELRRLQQLKWYDFFDSLPYWPMYLNGQGATARKLEPDRFRRTTEGGGPRQPTFDASGLQAISINDASHIRHMPQYFYRDLRPAFLAWLSQRGLPAPPDSGESGRQFSKWPKERKPTLAELMRDMAVFKRAAAVIGHPTYGFGDDAKDYFNQLFMAPSERWKLGIVFLMLAGDVLDRTIDTGVSEGALLFVSEKRLGFGTHGASNIAQRFSDALLDLFREDMDSADEDARRGGEAPEELAWLETRLELQRRRGEPCVPIKRWSEDPPLKDIPAPPRVSEIPLGYVCPQLRLYSVYMYSDDPQFLVVGIDRTKRALKCWRRLTSKLGLIMAIAAKRSLGSWSRC